MKEYGRSLRLDDEAEKKLLAGAKGASIDTVPVAGGRPRPVVSESSLLFPDPIYSTMVWFRDNRLAFVRSEPENDLGPL